MKKYLRFICISVAFAMLLSGQCFATDGESAQSLLQVSWSGNYLNSSAPELKIDVESSAGYIQTVAVVMYDDDFDAESEDNKPAITDYYRMDEVVVKKGETGTVKFKITEIGTPLADGAYKLLIQGSGGRAGESRVQIPVWVINPSGISGLISSFNNATVSNLKGYINEVEKPLQLEVGERESTDRLNAFLSIREKDYSNSFATLHDVERAWKISEIIDCLANASSDKAKLQNLFEIYAESIGIDTARDDYKDNTAAIYNNIVYNNDLSAADSISEIKELFDEAVAIATINSATGKTIAQKLAEYYDEAGISTDSYNKLADCSDKQVKIKIERMFLNKDFLTTDAIKETFDNAVDKYIKEDDDDSDSDSGSGNSGGGGGGVGGRTAIKGISAAVDAAVTSPAASQTPAASFGDCTAEHWAHSYIEALKESGIISGYSDGSFYPDRTVKREEFVKMAVLMCGLYDEGSECNFIDVLKDEWYYAYVSSAYKESIVTGLSEESFGIGADISRQDVAVIACRLLDKLGIEAGAEGENKVFTDADKIADYAAESVGILTKMTVINGFEDGSFRPEASLTRAEAAKILSLVKSYIKQ
ncbi:MAG: S-layer homology domain-containing protein [Clostridia bacterium]|nr:S-layer homology domain-containing protein [Clostridia bacterium]